MNQSINTGFSRSEKFPLRISTFCLGYFVLWRVKYRYITDRESDNSTENSVSAVIKKSCCLGHALLLYSGGIFHGSFSNRVLSHVLSPLILHYSRHERERFVQVSVEGRSIESRDRPLIRWK